MECELATDSPSRLATYRLASDRLVVLHKDRHQDEVFFADIAAINIQQTLGAYIMRITRRSHGSITVRSRCVRPSGVEDRVEDYANLVRGLHTLCRSHTTIDFIAGSSARFWMGWFLVVNSVLLLGITAFALADGMKGRWLSWMILSILIGSIGGVAFIRQGRSRAYDPNAPPPNLLPNVTESEPGRVSPD